MFKVNGIDHVEVFVRDLDAAVAWYRDVLGLEVVHRWDLGPVMIGTGESSLALFRARQSGPDNSDDDRQPPIRWRRVAWRVDGVGFQLALRHLRSQGIEFDGPIDHGVAQSIYFNDPDGNPLEITTYILK